MEGINFKGERMGTVVILTDKRSSLNTSISQPEDFKMIIKLAEEALAKIEDKEA